MGLDISKITNATLQAIAKEYDIVKSDGVLDETEFYLFEMNAKKPADVTDEAWTETLGLYVSNPNEKNEVTASQEKSQVSQTGLTNGNVELTKEAQIAKDRDILLGIYEEVKSSAKEPNYTEYLKAVKEEMKKTENKGKFKYGKSC